MKLNREKNTVECNGKSYPPTAHNAQVYVMWTMETDEDKKKALEGLLSEVSLDI